MSETQIVAVVLIRNEDLFIERVILNVLDFCDRIHVADHESTDGTSAIVRRLAAEHPKVEYRVVGHPSESHDMIAGYAGTPTWVMGVDGDEIYDPECLARLRPELLAGRYDGFSAARQRPERAPARSRPAAGTRLPRPAMPQHGEALQLQRHRGLATALPGATARRGHHLPAGLRCTRCGLCTRSSTGSRRRCAACTCASPIVAASTFRAARRSDPQGRRRDEALGVQPALLGAVALRP